MTGCVILAGGSGFLGQSLATRLRDEGSDVVILGRASSDASSAVRRAQWDGVTIGDWAGLLEGAHAVVNLTGRSVN
jgi:NAD dependent epimerase/dehydratase family enzyme